MTATPYDCIVIGSGQAGGPLAGAFARAKKRTALVEKTHVGGTCVNEGCSPTKTMVASARVAYLARRAADYGVHVGPVSVDLARVRQRKQAIVDSFRTGSEKGLASAGVDLIRGEARFRSSRTVEVCDSSGSVRELVAALIVINTGARPARPNLPGLENVPVLDSTSIMELDRLPDHLLVLGGGYIGLEFGQMFRRFGSKVTVVQRGSRLLGKEDADVADAVADILRDDGIEVLLNTQAVQVEGEPGNVRLKVSGGGSERLLEGSHLLVATGRTPSTDRLGLEAAGVQTDRRGFIKVDERLRTNVPGIYAVGDVNGGPAFTHISYDDYRILKCNLLEGGDATTEGRLVPYTVYIDPQLGRVGLGEEAARQLGRQIQVAKMPMSWVARALETDETRGFMKAVVDAATGQILGCAMLGLEGGEIMTIVQMAMLGQLPYQRLQDAIFAHPTLAEALNNLWKYLK